MMRNLLDCIMSDLEAWETELRADAREAMARRLAEHLDSKAGRAEHRFKDSGSLSWIFDARSGQLLVTYPNGANRIRVVAQPQPAPRPSGVVPLTSGRHVW